jgi:sugar phosphate isomerase/epimerase
VVPHVKHVHLRDTGRAAGKFQVRIGQGEIEYGRIINQLERQGYDRLLSVAIQDEGNGSAGTEAEARKLKFLLESLV